MTEPTSVDGLRYLDSVRDADPLMGQIADAIRTRLAADRAAIQKVRDEMAANNDADARDTQESMAEYGDLRRWLAALDAILEKRR